MTEFLIALQDYNILVTSISRAVSYQEIILQLKNSKFSTDTGKTTLIPRADFANSKIDRARFVFQYDIYSFLRGYSLWPWTSSSLSRSSLAIPSPTAPP